MEFLPSVSRSSGLEDGSNALKEPKVQEEYRTFIESKLQRYWSQYPAAGHLTASGTGKSSDPQPDFQSNILILFRKLREGLMASKRVDDFSIEVYEISLHLSVLFRIPMQTTSIMNQLIPHSGRGIYDTYTELSASEAEIPTSLARLSLGDSASSRRERQFYRPPHARREQTSYPSTASKTRSPLHSERQKSELRSNIVSTALIGFFHMLLHSYPSRAPYRSTLTYLQKSQFLQENNRTKDVSQWLKSIGSAVASRNFVQFESLSRSNKVDDVCHRLNSQESRGIDYHLEMRRLCLKCLVEDLRTKVRRTVWDILAVTYRELDTIGSAEWLLQTLMIAPDPMVGNSEALSNSCQLADRWLEQRGENEARRKEGSQGRWVLCRRQV